MKAHPSESFPDRSGPDGTAAAGTPADGDSSASDARRPGAAALRIREAGDADADALLELRCALWPYDRRARLEEETRRFLADEAYAFLVAEDGAGPARGLVEVSVRPHAPGADTACVGYLEAWYVDPALRRRGVGRRLVRAAEAWAAARGCVEMASDCHADNATSRAAHAALGYREHATLVHFAKRLSDGDAS